MFMIPGSGEPGPTISGVNLFYLEWRWELGLWEDINPDVVTVKGIFVADCNGIG